MHKVLSLDVNGIPLVLSLSSTEKNTGLNATICDEAFRMGAETIVATSSNDVLELVERFTDLSLAENLKSSLARWINRNWFELRKLQSKTNPMERFVGLANSRQTGIMRADTLSKH